MIAFRDEGPADAPVVRRAHVEHRRAIFAGLDWLPDALARLLDGQHELQERHIAAHHPGAERRMILVRGKPVGRLCLDKARVPWRLVDLALVPEAQGCGTGGAVLRRIRDEATGAAAAVELHVGRDNPRAEALYRRHGFVEAIGASATHRRMILPAR